MAPKVVAANLPPRPADIAGVRRAFLSAGFKMPIERKMIKCDPADPNRCQGREGPGGGQCTFLAVPNQLYCLKHGGAAHEAIAEKKRVSLYRLQKWQERVDEFASSEQALSLRDEAGILRLQLESIHNMCDSPQDLLLYSSRMADLVMKIDKVVNSIAKIESKSTALLDKSAALILAGQIVDTIAGAISTLPIPEQQQAQVIDDISSGIIGLVAKLAGKDLSDDE